MKRLDDQVQVRGQMLAGEVAGCGAATIINNRPDGEEPRQPTSAEIAAACDAAGIAYHHIPIAHGIGPADVAAMRAALDGNGPVVAFCRSGQRSTMLWALAEHERGRDADTLRRAAEGAGYTLQPIAHLLG